MRCALKIKTLVLVLKRKLKCRPQTKCERSHMSCSR